MVGPEALASAVVRSADIGLVSTDTSGRVTGVNPKAEAIFGVAAADVVGRSLGRLLTPASDAAEVLRELRHEGVAGRRGHWQHADGQRLDLTAALTGLTDAGGTEIGSAIVLRDIGSELETSRTLAEIRHELEEKNRHLERSNSELEQFAYVASHDLSEPLRAVAGMVALLARRYQGRLDDDADDFISFAVEGCERMRAMIEDLLAYSRVGRVELRHEPVDMQRVLAEVRSMLSDQIAAAEVTILGSGLPVVEGDPAQLTRVVQNLLSNAIKFRRPDEPVEVEVTATVRPGGGWRFEVADNGIGIEPVYRERIFRMFQRLHSSDSYAGTGIGLAIASRLVERLGGTMGVEGNASGGSTFWFTLS